MVREAYSIRVLNKDSVAIATFCEDIINIIENGSAVDEKAAADIIYNIYDELKPMKEETDGWQIIEVYADILKNNNLK